MNKTNFVDRYFVMINGEVSHGWLTGVASTNELPDIDRIKEALILLVNEGWRLNMIWDKVKNKFISIEREINEIYSILKLSDKFIENVDFFDAEIDLSKDIPFRITISPNKENDYKYKIAIQLHHSVGDAKTFLFIYNRLWELYQSPKIEKKDFRSISNLDFIIQILRRPLCIFNLFIPKYLLSAKRGYSISENVIDEVGKPFLSSFKVKLPTHLNKHYYLSALITASSKAIIQEKKKITPLRFRIPVDLRYFFRKKNLIGNVLTAIPVEISKSELMAMQDKNHLIVSKSIYRKIKKYIYFQLHWSSILESIILSRIFSNRYIRNRIKKDYLSEKRTNSMIITHLGNVNKYVKNSPIQLHDIKCHTPTFGISSYVLGEYLHIHISSFENLYSKEKTNILGKKIISEIGKMK